MIVLFLILKIKELCMFFILQSSTLIINFIYLMRQLLVLLTFLCANIAISPLKSIHNLDVNLSILLGFILNFSLILLFVNKLKDRVKATRILLLAIIGVSVMSLPFHILHFKATLGSLLGYLVNIIAIFGAYGYTKLTTAKNKCIYIIISVIFAIIMSTWVSGLWKSFVLEIIN